MRRRLGRIAAWAVTGGALSYLFWRVPIREMAKAASNAAGWTFPVLAALVMAVYLADCLAIWKTFGWFVAPLGFREVLTVRGATYLLALVNYALGQAAIVYFVKRSRGVPLVRGSAAVLLIMGTNLLLLLFMTTAGMVLGAETIAGLRRLMLVGYAGLALYLVLLVWKPRFLTKRPLFDVLLTAGVWGYLKAMAVRLPHVLTLVCFSYATLHALGVKVPVLQAVLCTPVVLLVAVLPISVQGLGPTQGAMVFFFARYAPGDSAHREAAVLAASMLAWAIALAVQILVSLVCLRSELAQGLKEMPQEQELSAAS